METIVIDKPGVILWSALVFFVVLTSSIIVGHIATRIKTRHLSPDERKRAFAKGADISAALIASAGLAFFTYLFYKDFNSVAVRSDSVELRYYWPKSPVVLHFAEIGSARIVRDSRYQSRASVHLYAKGTTYSSAQTLDWTGIQHLVDLWEKTNPPSGIRPNFSTPHSANLPLPL